MAGFWLCVATGASMFSRDVLNVLYTAAVAHGHTKTAMVCDMIQDWPSSISLGATGAAFFTTGLSLLTLGMALSQTLGSAAAVFLGMRLSQRFKVD